MPVRIGRLGAVLVMAAPVAFSGCFLNDCDDVGFEQGEHFAITILGLTKGYPGEYPDHCGIAPLEVGTRFTITGGELLQEPTGCGIRGAAPEVPAPFRGVLSECKESPRAQLALSCSGQLPSQCTAIADMYVGPLLRRSDVVVDQGYFIVDWVIVDWTTGPCNGACTHDTRSASSG